MAFFAGYSADAFFTTADNNTSALNSSSPQISEQSRLENPGLTDKKLDAILSKLNNISLTINETNSAPGRANNDRPTLDNAADTNIDMNPDEINNLKNDIYNSLLQPDYTFSQLTSSEALNSLSEIDKKEVLDEVAHRLDSGEIDIENFLPGYKKPLN